MVSTCAALSINVVLNYGLIFGAGPFPAMGVRGAALATVIARSVEMIILVGFSYARKYVPAARPAELLGFDFSFVRRFFRITAPVILNELIWSLGVTCQNIIFAQTHTDAIAAFNITNTVSQLTWVVFIGLGNGSAVLVGNKIGEGNEAAARDYAFRITLFSPLAALGAVLILLPISRLLPFLFNVTPAVLSYTGIMFVILSINYPFKAFNMAMVIGVCRAGGDTVFCVIYDLVFMWLISLPLAAGAGFIFGAPVWVLYAFIAAEDPLKMFLGLWRLKTGRWLNNVIRS
jgi:putative MATE family efflux protein